MPNVILYYAHPGQQFSQVNAAMYRAAETVDGITCVDLYAEYPRFEVNVDREQDRLLSHDIIVFQFPFFWYSTPSIIKEWQDIVLEHGFAYGKEGTALTGKKLQLAISAAGPEDAYSPDGYQHHNMRTFLRPLEQTAALCKMEFLVPYVLYASLRAPGEDQVHPHVEGYRHLLEGLRDDRFMGLGAAADDVMTYATLPVLTEH